MTRLKLYCPYCNTYTLRYPEEITIEMTHRAAATGIVRWEHCGLIRFRPSSTDFRRTLAAGCRIECPDIDQECDTFTRQLDRVVTPADMGFVS